MSNNETFLSELTSVILQEYPQVNINEIQTSILKIINKYEITIKSTELIAVDPIPKCLKDYLVIRKGEGIAVSTLKQYGLAIKNFLQDISMPIEKICTNDIRLYLETAQDQYGWSNRYKALISTIISTFFKWSYSEGYLQKNPAENLKPVKYTRNPKGYLTDEQLETLIGACSNIRDKAIIELFASTGCRVSELINIKIRDIDFGKMSIQIRGKGDKVRMVYFEARAKISMQEYLKTRTDDNEYLFVYNRVPYEPFTRSGIEALIKRLGKSVGLEVYPHKLRHTMATMCVRKGMPIQNVQKILGHVNINTTMVYTEVADESVQQSHKQFAF